MKIIQLTDLHVGREGEDTFGVDVRGNFLKALRAIASHSPDHLVVSGDLCYRTGDPVIYEWIREELTGLPFPVWLLSGNHDDPVMLAKSFGLGDGFLQEDELYYRAVLGEQTFLFLDTTSYMVSAKQLSWLKASVEGHSGPLNIFMHHPPALMDVPFMDGKYPLKNWAAVQDLLLGHTDDVLVFSGHYHVDKSVHLKNLHIFVTPSTFFQIAQDTDEFRVDHYRIGWRELAWEGDLFRTTVRYIDAE